MEKFDLFDKDRISLDRQIVRGEKVPSDTYRQVVHIAVFNSKGELLIQQRQPFKYPYPNLWDISVGGSVIAGENSRQGAERELFEELGIKFDFSNTRQSLTINFKEGFDDVYIISQDVDIENLNLQDEEVQRVKWATLGEVLKLMEDGLFIGYYDNFIRLIFDMSNKPYGTHKS